MRELTAAECAALSGCGLWDDFLEFLSMDFGGGSVPVAATVTISAARLSDVQKFSYDLEMIRQAAPDCKVVIGFTGGVQSNTINAGFTATVPTLGSTETRTVTKPTITYECPPKSGITQNRSD